MDNGAIRYGAYTNNSVYFTKIEKLSLPKVQSIGTMSLCGLQGPLDAVVLPSLRTKLWSASNGRAFEQSTTVKYYDFGNESITSMSWGSSRDFYATGTVIEAIIFRYGGVVSIGDTNVFLRDNTNNLPFGTTCFIYVPSALLSQYQAATNWSTLYSRYPDMFKTIESTHTDPNAFMDLTLYHADGSPLSS